MKERDFIASVNKKINTDIAATLQIIAHSNSLTLSIR